MIPTVNWSYPTAIRFGAGRIKELAAACAQAGITRPLLVTDRGLASMAITTQALDILEAGGVRRGAEQRLQIHLEGGPWTRLVAPDLVDDDATRDRQQPGTCRGAAAEPGQ